MSQKSINTIFPVEDNPGKQTIQGIRSLVRYRASGQHPLGISFSAFDPNRRFRSNAP